MSHARCSDCFRSPHAVRPRHQGRAQGHAPRHLAALVIDEAVKRSGRRAKPRSSDVVLGCAMPEAEQGMNVARIAALAAGLPVDVPGHDRQPLLLLGRAVDRARSPIASPPAPTTSASPAASRRCR